MSERLDREIRLLVSELADSAPEPPPLPVARPAGARWWPVAAAAAAITAVVFGVVSFLVPSSDDSGDAAAETTTTFAAATTAAPATTSAGDAADTTEASADRVAAIVALEAACAAHLETGDLEAFRADVVAVDPPPGDGGLFTSLDVQFGRALALEARGDADGVNEQLARIAEALVDYGAAGCEPPAG